MNGRLVRVVAAAVAALWLAGCAMTSSYNPGYLSAARRPAAVQADGKTVAVGNIPPLKLGPRETAEVTLPLPAITPQPGVEYFLDVSWTLKANAPWGGRAGDEMAFDQFKLPAERPIRKERQHLVELFLGLGDLSL